MMNEGDSRGSQEPIYHEILIERGPSHWRASFDGEIVGVVPADPAAAREFQLFVSGGAAHFEDVTVTELVSPAS